MSAATVVPIRQSLWDIEERLAGLLDTAEAVLPEQEDEFVQELRAVLATAADKRDAVAGYMSHVEAQIQLAKDEIQRLRIRRQSLEDALDRIKTYTVRCMEGLEVKKLEGRTVTLSLRRCPASVEVTDEDQVPLAYKTAQLTMPADLADQILDTLPFDAPVTLQHTVSKTAIKAALDEGARIPGAAFAEQRNTLVRK